MFRKPTVDSVVATFNKTVTDLEAIADEQSANASAARLEAVRQQAIAEAAADEQGRALNVANKIRALIS